MEISRRVAEQLRQMKRQIDSLEARLRALTFNTSATDSHYLVEAPVDGIPAFVDPIPGMANCNIVRRFSNDTDEDKELAVSTSKERVYNLGPAIADGEIVVAHRDAFGDLFIPVGNGGGCNIPDTIVELQAGDYVQVVRDGECYLAEIRVCEPPADPSSSGSTVSSSVPP